MASPDIRVYYWGKVSGVWGWQLAGYSQDGETLFAGARGYPITIPGPGGDASQPAIVSDSINSDRHFSWAGVPIVITNVGDATLKDMNLDVVSHYWATSGKSNSDTGFRQFWDAFAPQYASGSNLYRDSYNQQARSDWSQDFGNPSRWSISGTPVGERFVENSRVSTVAAFDTGGSIFQTQPSLMYNRLHSGLAFLMASDRASFSYGDQNMSLDSAWLSYRTTELGSGDKAAARLAAFGDPRSTAFGWYGAQVSNVYQNYRDDGPSGPYTGDECCFKTFEGLNTSYGTAHRSLANLLRFGRQWQNINRRTTPFNQRTIQNTGGVEYDVVSSNNDQMFVGRVLRGYAWLSLVDSNAFNSIYSGQPQVVDLEGKVFGRHFETIVVTGRYYA